MADAGEGGLARVELGNCAGLLADIFNWAPFNPPHKTQLNHAVLPQTAEYQDSDVKKDNDLHSGPTPRGKLSAAANVP